MSQAEVDPLPLLQLPGSQRQLAAAIAHLVVCDLAPGCAPVTMRRGALDDWRAYGPGLPGHWKTQICVWGPNVLFADVDVRPSAGTIDLRLESNGRGPIWAGTLRETDGT